MEIKINPKMSPKLTTRVKSQGLDIQISRVRDSNLKSQNIQCYTVRD